MVALIALVVIVYGGRVAFRRFFKHITTVEQQERCRCGYVVENLSMPRCPECGRVIGFNATAEELGLTDEQLLRAQSAKAKRKADLQ